MTQNNATESFHTAMLTASKLGSAIPTFGTGIERRVILKILNILCQRYITYWDTYKLQEQLKYCIDCDFFEFVKSLILVLRQRQNIRFFRDLDKITYQDVQNKIL